LPSKPVSRIDIDGAAEFRLDFRHSQSTKVVLYFSELSGVLTATGVLPDGSATSAKVTPTPCRQPIRSTCG